MISIASNQRALPLLPVFAHRQDKPSGQISIATERYISQLPLPFCAFSLKIVIQGRRLMECAELQHERAAKSCMHLLEGEKLTLMYPWVCVYTCYDDKTNINK